MDIPIAAAYVQIKRQRLRYKNKNASAGSLFPCGGAYIIGYNIRVLILSL